MSNFSRVFKYVWPQWPRITVVIVSAIIVSSLLSLSFMTVIWLLKVMMGEEGLHGWVEREICSHRYGINFSVSEMTDFAQSDVSYHLLVTDIKDKSPAKKAGLKKMDIVIGVGNFLVEKEGQNVPRAKLLETLATAPASAAFPIQLSRLNSKSGNDTQTLGLNTGPKTFYVDYVEKWMNLLPREQT